MANLTKRERSSSKWVSIKNWVYFGQKFLILKNFLFCLGTFHNWSRLSSKGEIRRNNQILFGHIKRKSKYLIFVEGCKFIYIPIRNDDVSIIYVQSLTTFGVSPNETAFYKASLSRISVKNALVMIQPALLQYTIDDPVANSVNLDIKSFKTDVVLLLDTYFNVIVWNGENIQKWIEEGYYDNCEYRNLKKLVDAPNQDVQIFMDFNILSLFQKIDSLFLNQLKPILVMDKTFKQKQSETICQFSSK